MKTIINFIASGLYISYIPNYFSKTKTKYRGCGLFGTIIAFIFLPILPEKNFVPFILFFLIFSIYISHKAFNKDEKDNPLIVIDEITGYWFGFIFIEISLINSIVLFILFRIFDTIKPYPIKKLENIKYRGLSIVIDDIIASIYSVLILMLFKKIV